MSSGSSSQNVDIAAGTGAEGAITQVFFIEMLADQEIHW